MGHGYWILMWDGYGSGLTLLNARLYTDGVDLYGNPRNWWSYEKEGGPTYEQALEAHPALGEHPPTMWKVICQ